MRPFNIFRASFDGSLDQKHRRKAGIAAIAITGVVFVGAAVALLSLLHHNSDGLSGFANAGPANDVRVLGGQSADGKSCEDQTWPFIEGRCLTKGTPAKTAERTAPKQGLASRDVVIPSPDKQLSSANPGSPTLMAPTPPVSAMAATTTGAATRLDESDDDDPGNEAASVPLPPERPAQIALAKEAVSAEEQDPPLGAAAAPKFRSERDMRRFWQREERERREQVRREARKLWVERRAAIREERIARRNERMERRWSDYRDDPRGRDDEDMIVIRRGPRGENSFGIFR